MTMRMAGNTFFRLAVLPTALLGGMQAAHATNGDQMLGVTATQWGMAGAIVAAPQDAATALTNPAGLATLDIEEVRFDLGFGMLNPPRSVTQNGTTYESESNAYLMPAGGAAFRIDEALYFGIGMGGISGSGVDFADTAPGAGSQAIVTTKQFYKIAPGFGFRAGERLSLGAALNIDFQSLAMYTPAYQFPQNQVYGYGFSAGAIYQVSDAIQLGAVYISQQNMGEFTWNTTSGAFSLSMNGPAQAAIGLAMRPRNGTLVEFDIRRIWFSDVLDSIEVERPSGYAGAVPASLNFGWDDQTVFALGVQQQVGARTAVRFGVNYGASPIGPEDVANNKGSLAITELHVTAGLTRQLSDKVSGSFSYAHAFNNEVTSTDGLTSIELEQNVFNLQVSYKY
jgi:long-chain fatty acid transport protein